MVGISFTVYFGLKARKYAERLDSYLRANTRLGQVVDMGGGRSGRVVELPSGRFGVAYTVQPSAALSISGDVKVRKIPAAKDEEE